MVINRVMHKVIHMGAHRASEGRKVQPLACTLEHSSLILLHSVVKDDV
jgi:hypothetical protein